MDRPIKAKLSDRAISFEYIAREKRAESTLSGRRRRRRIRPAVKVIAGRHGAGRLVAQLSARQRCFYLDPFISVPIEAVVRQAPHAALSFYWAPRKGVFPRYRAAHRRTEDRVPHLSSVRRGASSHLANVSSRSHIALRTEAASRERRTTTRRPRFDRRSVPRLIAEKSARFRNDSNKPRVLVPVSRPAQKIRRPRR